MRGIRLTKRVIDAAKYQGSGACYLWDSEIAGFGLRIYPSGRKSFVLSYRVRGKQRFPTLGRFGEMTVDQARTAALEMLARACKGEDPGAERKAYRCAPTVEDLAARFMKDHAWVKKKPRSAHRDQLTWNRHILPRFGKRKVADIDRADVAKLHSDLGATPVKALSNPTGLSAAEWYRKIRERVPRGRRNQTLAQVAGLLFRRLPADVAAEFAYCWAQVRMNPPLPDREIMRTLDSIASRELRRRGRPA